LSGVVNETSKRLLARIRQLREARSLTQEAFAERAGLTYKHYQQVEAGRKEDIRLSTLIKIAKALDLEPWELLSFDFTPPVMAEGSGKYVGKGAAPVKGIVKPPPRRGATGQSSRS
jgi:transcriptional regulator with XRE-family HTH domain